MGEGRNSVVFKMGFGGVRVYLIEKGEKRILDRGINNSREVM